MPPHLLGFEGSPHQQVYLEILNFTFQEWLSPKWDIFK